MLRIPNIPPWRLGVACWVVILAGAACGDSAGPPRVVTVAVNPAQTVLCRSDSVRLTAIARDANGDTVTGVSFQWSSSNSNVATVDQAGHVHAVSGGTAIIRATQGAVHGVSGIQVPALGATFSYEFPSVFSGDTVHLHATLMDSAGLPGPAQATWTSQAPGIATVTADGIATGVSPGEAPITLRGQCGPAGTVTVAVLSTQLANTRGLAYIADTVRSDTVVANYARTVFHDSSQVTTVSAPDALVNEVAWSRDGSRLVMSYPQPASVAGSYIAGPDGSGPVPVGEYLWSPDWSPDGTRIVYRNYIASGESDIYSRGAPGGQVRRLTSAAGDDVVPRWSPDGRQILYTRLPLAAKPELWVMASDSSHRRQVSLPVGALNATWSPDGKYIAFDNGIGVWLVNADGTGARPVTPNCTPAGSCVSTETYVRPGWSPDGRQLVVVQMGWRLGILTVSGTTVSPITPLVDCCSPYYARWSPDGSLIAFHGVSNGGVPWPAIGVVQPDGGALRWVSGAENVDVGAGGPRWRP